MASGLTVLIFSLMRKGGNGSDPLMLGRNVLVSGIGGYHGEDGGFVKRLLLLFLLRLF